MAKKIALVLGVVFTLVGLLGFIGNPIVGVAPAWFEAGTAHSLVHLVSGIVFLLVAFKFADKAGLAMKVFGIVYLLVAILGFAGMTPVLGFIDVNDADNWLHLVLGLVIAVAGFTAGKSSSVASAPMNGGMQM